MKILQLGKAYPPVNLGGVEVTIQLITEGLHKLNVKCDVLGVNNTSKSEEENTKFGIIYRESLIIKAFSTLFSFNLILKLISIRNNYDIIHIHHPDPMSCFALWLSRPKCKIVLHWHSDILKQKKLLKLFKPFQTWILNRSNAIICTSKPYAENSNDLKKYLEKVKIIPIGINNAKYPYDEQLVKNIKSKFKNKNIILSIGRMSYYKGYEYLIEATKYLNPDSILFIIGDGELKQDFEQKIIRDNLSEKIILLGKVSDLEKNSYLKASDVFVLSSIFKTEAFAIVQVEAMSFSKPIVSTKIPNSGVDWVNQNMMSGLTVPICDAISLANAINSLTENVHLYDILSDGAFKRYNENFTQEVMSKNIFHLYKNLLA
jgi:rhamnosyl/mannosyltransferase